MRWIGSPGARRARGIGGKSHKCYLRLVVETEIFTLSIRSGLLPFPLGLRALATRRMSIRVLPAPTRAPKGSVRLFSLYALCDRNRNRLQQPLGTGEGMSSPWGASRLPPPSRPGMRWGCFAPRGFAERKSCTERTGEQPGGRERPRLTVGRGFPLTQPAALPRFLTEDGSREGKCSIPVSDDARVWLCARRARMLLLEGTEGWRGVLEGDGFGSKLC